MSTQLSSLEASIARIFRPSSISPVEDVTGAGFLVGGRRLLTCDHVLDVALDFSDGDPGDDIAVLVLRVEPKRTFVPGHGDPVVTPSG